jgi:putative transcriptional regulator
MMAARKGTAFGSRLIAAAEEALQIERGELKAPRVSRYTAAKADVQPPPEYEPDEIRRIRSSMELSQVLFAAALNVSPETVRAWEQGKREPDGPTQRLLEVAQDHPEVFMKKVSMRRTPRRSTVSK